MFLRTFLISNTTDKLETLNMLEPKTAFVVEKPPSDVKRQIPTESEKGKEKETNPKK